MSRLALFDCDGTLIDSQASICRSMGAAFAAIGLPAPPHAEVRTRVGLSLDAMVAALLPDADATLRTTIVDHYRDAFRDLRKRGELDEPLYEGVVDVLGKLGDSGWLLGVATGKSERGLALALARHGLAHHFVTLQAADRHPSKPHPSMISAAMAEAGVEAGATVMIGDTGWDMTMAANAGVRAVGVAWGYHSVAELRATGAAAIAHHPRELPGLLS